MNSTGAPTLVHDPSCDSAGAYQAKIKRNKPPFQYSVYRECSFFRLISHSTGDVERLCQFRCNQLSPPYATSVLGIACCA
eukprot:1937677-Rhodomonas_salina.4